MEALTKLNPAFKKNGTVTAGNASGINDGAAAVVLMSQSEAIKRNLEPLAKIVSWATCGVDPSLMGSGPIPASKKALKLADKIIVGISDGNEKNFLFPIDERLKIVSKALYGDLKLSKKKIQVIKFNSLTTELCKKYKST